MPDQQDWKIRGIVTELVKAEVAPLALTVNRMDRTLRSLYRNGSDGPPGFLETARAEDKAQIEELLRLKREDSGRLEALEKTAKDQDIARAVAAEIVAKEVKSAEKRFNRRMAFASLLVAIFMAWMGWREYLRKISETAPAPAVHYSQQAPVTGSIDTEHGH